MTGRRRIRREAVPALPLRGVALTVVLFALSLVMRGVLGEQDRHR